MNCPDTDAALAELITLIAEQIERAEAERPAWPEIVEQPPVRFFELVETT